MNQQTYTAALEAAVLYDEQEQGRIAMRGSSAADLLHRLSTNDINRLKPGQGTRTVLTTPIGRIIDVLTVYVQAEQITIVSGPGQGGPVFSHLRKNIFFNDKVTLEPLGRSHAQFALYGPHAPALLARVFGVDFAGLVLHATVAGTLAGFVVLVARTLPLGGQGFRLILPIEGAEAVRAAILEAGAATLDPPTFDVLRVEAGYGATNHELNQEYIPLETGLEDAISFTKGCYVGQEIIARMESRGRRAKALRGLRLPSTFNLQPLALALPAKLAVDGKDAGDLTSVVVSPRFGPIGLAYVRSAHLEPGTHVSLAGSDLVGTVVELPFEQA
ncbi:MAG: aminomethyl transferase family protein [Roseiflexaceae bacterium]|nr:aminomethyl transferase family protein [Roseiflexaceae bacterium]